MRLIVCCLHCLTDHIPPFLQCLYNQEQKGTISTLEAVDGLLLACMGQKVRYSSAVIATPCIFLSYIHPHVPIPHTLHPHVPILHTLHPHVPLPHTLHPHNAHPHRSSCGTSRITRTLWVWPSLTQRSTSTMPLPSRTSSSSLI